MKTTRQLPPLVALLFVGFPSQRDEPATPVVRFDDGLWFDGKTFESRTVFSVEGRFVLDYEGDVDSTVDLAGGFVVPPLADAHNHGLGTGQPPEVQDRAFSARGIFYVKNPNNLHRLAEPLLPFLARPGTVDAIFSHGGLTCSGGHPVQVYEHSVPQHAYAVWGIESLDTEAYYVVDSLEELDEKWGHITGDYPDFLKVYLESAEHHAERVGDDAFYGKRALDPALVPDIVEKAHEEGLPVAAHVTSAYDFHVAVAAGVDEIAHLPLYMIDPKDAELAARQGTIVVTTVTSHRNDHFEGGAAALEDALRFNLATLLEAGVTIAVGTDSAPGTIVGEIEKLDELTELGALAWLRIAFETTPRRIFPERSIGRLEEGYEASFLVLERDPLEDLAALREIALAFKQGHPVDVSAPAPQVGARAGHGHDDGGR